jgi:hypothetical protein
MTTTRKYIESLLDSINKLCEVSSDSMVDYISIKNEVNSIFKKIKQYRLFQVKLSSEIYDSLESQKIPDFHGERQEILVQLISWFLNTEIMLDIRTLHKEPDYIKSIELSLCKLGAETYFNIKKKINGIHKESWWLNQFNEKFEFVTQIKNQADLDTFNAMLLKDKKPIRHLAQLEKIQSEDLNKVKTFFVERLKEHKKFILDNYPSIKNEFGYYNSEIRIYLINHVGGKAHLYVQCYKRPFDEEQIIICDHYLDYTPWESSNLEEIEEEMQNGLFTFVKIDRDFDGNRPRIMSQHDIYRELVNIYIRNSSKSALITLFSFLLKCKGIKVNVDNTLKPNFGDLISEDENGIRSIIFLDNKDKNYKEQITDWDKKKNSDKLTLVSTYPLSEELIKLFDGSKMKFDSVMNLIYEQLNNDNAILLHWFIKDNLKQIEIKENKEQQIGDSLIQKLEKCPKGIKGWAEYESICTDIFDFLFSNDFRNYTFRNQSYTHDNIFRRDLIINNNFKDSTSIWAKSKVDFNANIIVIDFKNYAKPLEQNELYLPTKYLNLSTGNFGIVICRTGLSPSAKTLQRRLLNADKKLIIILTDTDLIKMIQEKIIGVDISYMLETKLFLLYEHE